MPHDADRLTKEPALEYDVIMTVARHSSSVRADSDFLQNSFNNLPGDRAARVFHLNKFQKPHSAAVNSAGRLTWKWLAVDKFQAFPSTLCFDFAGLSEASDEQICAFARRWGPLGFGDTLKEHTSEWKIFARLARSILRITTPEQNKEDRRVIWEWIAPQSPIDDLPSSPSEALTIAVGAVNLWYSRAHGHIILDLVKNQPRVRLGGANMFGILAVQLAHQLAHSDQKAVCGGCDRPFALKRPRSRGVRQYCPNCRKDKVPQRHAARDYRRRNRLGE